MGRGGGLRIPVAKISALVYVSAAVPTEQRCKACAVEHELNVLCELVVAGNCGTTARKLNTAALASVDRNGPRTLCGLSWLVQVLTD